MMGTPRTEHTFLVRNKDFLLPLNLDVVHQFARLLDPTSYAGGLRKGRPRKNAKSTRPL